MNTRKKIGLVVFAVALMGVGWAGATTTNDATVGGPGISGTSKDNDWVQSVTVDFADNTCTSNDCVQFLKVPGSNVVRFVQYTVLTTNYASGQRTFNIGKPSVKTQWASEVSGATAASALSATNWIWFTAGATLELEALDTITNGTVRIRVGGSDCSK